MMNLSKSVFFLKRIALFTVMGLFIINVYGEQGEEPVSIDPASIDIDTHSLSNYKAYEKCLEQTKELMVVSMQVMHELFMHENYWKTQKLTPLAYFLSKDPTKWVYRKQEWQKIDSSIAFLEHEQEHHAYYLGLFNQLVNDYELDSLYSEKKLIQTLELIEQFLSYYPHSTKVYRDGQHSESYTQRVDRNAYLISYYRKNARRAVFHCSAPNHFQRNWLGYFIGTTSLLGISYFMYKNQSKLESWAEVVIGGLKKYYHEHVSSPIIDSLKALFRHDRKPLQSREGVDAAESSIIRSSTTDLELKHPELSQEQKKEIVQQIAEGNLDFVYQNCDGIMQDLCDLEKEVKGTSISSKVQRGQIFVNNLPKILELVRLYEIQLKDLLFMVKKGALDTEKLINANIINFELAAVLPSALLAYFSYSLSKFLFTKIVLQKNTYQPLRRSLRHLHMIYNRYAAKNDLLSIADQGFCYYWIEQFKKYSVQLQLGERKMILDDLAELELSSFNATQKLSVIQRMYYNYHFLLPSLD